jgi:hypothetical protein
MPDETKMTTEEKIMAHAIEYIETHDGYKNERDADADESFIELAKKLARTLKAKLVKVEDNFGEGF